MHSPTSRRCLRRCSSAVRHPHIRPPSVAPDPHPQHVQSRRVSDSGAPVRRAYLPEGIYKSIFLVHIIFQTPRKLIFKPCRGTRLCPGSQCTVQLVAWTPGKSRGASLCCTAWVMSIACNLDRRGRFERAAKILIATTQGTRAPLSRGPKHKVIRGRGSTSNHGRGNSNCKCSFVRVLSRARTHAQALATNSGWNAYGDCRAAINNLASRVLTYSS